MNRKFPVRFIAITLLLLRGCNCHKSPTEPTPKEQRNYIRGKVILENQTNHASCIVFLDSLFIGTATDSSGYFEIMLPDSLSNVSGAFDIFYYIFSFRPEKATIELHSGRIVPGLYDADSSGTLKTVLLNQLVRMTVTTDKNTYSLFGDRILLWVEIFNTWIEPIGYFPWEQKAAGQSWFYNLENGKLVQYLTRPAGISTYYRIEPNTSRSEEDALNLPFKHNSWPDEDFPPGEYLFMPMMEIVWFSGIDFYDMYNKLESFLKHQDCSSFGEGFVTGYAKVRIMNTLDTKDLYFPQITITP